MKTKINQAGSHVIAVALMLCVLGVMVFAGIKVIGGHKVAANTKTEAASSPTPSISVPAGWRLFADKSVGVQFIYPAAYGAFAKSTPQASDGFESAMTSAQLTTDYLPGVAGRFTLGTYKNASAEITTRRDGPKVKLAANEWIVAAPNPYDGTTYHKGDVYPELADTNTHGINVYTATDSSEGITIYELYFVSQGKLHELRLPPFNSDLDSSTYNVNDQTPYDTMFGQVRDSVSLY